MFLMEYERTRTPEERKHLSSICCGAPLGPEGPAAIVIKDGKCDIDGVKFQFYPDENIKGGFLISEDKSDIKENIIPEELDHLILKGSGDPNVTDFKNLKQTKLDSQCTKGSCKSKGESHD